MYRTVFTPTEQNNRIPFSVPREWYGCDIEVIVFPINEPQIQSQNTDNERKFKPIPSKYLFETKNFKFNRDEANDYE